jgi:tetratricopeptide (TPR) repeat protein
MQVWSRLVWLSVVCAAFSSSVALAGAEEAAQKFSEGQELLAKANFAAALKAYDTASKADGANDVYRQATAVLQRVIKMRKGLDKLSGPEWVLSADALLAYYMENRVFSEALPLARGLHSKLDTPESAARLARTELALDLNADAAKHLEAIESGERTPEVRVLLGLALARQGEMQDAKAAVADLMPPEDASAMLLFDLACVQARVGQTAPALTTLAGSFEKTPPSQLEAAKGRAKACPDLGALKTEAEFVKVLATASKVAESKCSSGADCGKCPSHSKCAAGQKAEERSCGAAKNADKQEAGQPE